MTSHVLFQNVPFVPRSDGILLNYLKYIRFSSLPNSYAFTYHDTPPADYFNISKLKCLDLKYSSVRVISTTNTMTLQNGAQKNNSDSNLMKLARHFNNFYFNGYRSNIYKPLFCQGHHIGLVAKEVEQELIPYQDVFSVNSNQIDICPEISGFQEISDNIDRVLRSIRDKDLFQALRGWRNETYDICAQYGQPALFAMERSATCMFGLRQYGVDVNGYIKDDNDQISVWLQKRSVTKPTWPGRWDNFVSGGLSTGYSVRETVIKETNEEANLPLELAEKIQPAGCVSFFFQSERGIFPQTEIVFDLELPKDFVPSNNDGEVDEFCLVPASQLVEKICDPQMKTTSCPVTLDFMIRKGILTHDTEPNLPELTELLHIPLHNLYKKD